MKKAHRKGQQRLKRRKLELRRKRMAARKASKAQARSLIAQKTRA